MAAAAVAIWIGFVIVGATTCYQSEDKADAFTGGVATGLGISLLVLSLL